jgi:hypothetical protein
VLNEDVAGVIISGGSCGFFGSPAQVGIKQSSRFLAIAGSKDEFISSARSSGQYRTYCRQFFNGPDLETLFLPGVGHGPAPWRPEVAKVISKILDVEPVVLARTNGDVSKGVPEEFKAAYKSWKRHKAFAINGAGVMGAVGELDTQFDAEEAALIKCDLEFDINPYLSSNHAHKCFLVDVNDNMPK